jgi:glutamyl-tRNA synthetase
VNETQVRVRFAPSPTGQLHVGSARTALYNWAFARRHGGSFILRIDDTDPERSTHENTQAILDALRWLGLDWDEGPEVGGECGPYFQTQRTDIYAAALDRLVADGKVYPCFCSVEELKAKREDARVGGGTQGYDHTCRRIDAETARVRIDASEEYVWRLAVPEDRGEIVFHDAVRGDMSFPASSMDDMIIVRSDGSPTYNFATVVDDVQMEISHVIRGDDHLSNTPRQILVFEALGHSIPVFAHMSMTFGPDGKRLSKRHGAASVEAFRDMGFLSDALVNYIVLLGWSLDDKTTIMDRETIASGFSLERLSSNPGIFDTEKLEWMNGVYLREMPRDVFARYMIETLAAAGLVDAGDAISRPEYFAEMAGLFQDRVKRLDEMSALVRFLFIDEVEIEEKARTKVLEKEGAGRSLDAAIRSLDVLTVFDERSVEEALRVLPEQLGLKPRVVFQSIRVAVSGTMVSPPLFESLALLGRERTLSRITAARSAAAS